MADKADKTDGTDSLLLRMGVIGTVIVALCCFAPVLVVLLGWRLAGGCFLNNVFL